MSYDDELLRACRNYRDSNPTLNVPENLAEYLRAIMKMIGPVACWGIALGEVRADAFAQWSEVGEHP